MTSRALTSRFLAVLVILSGCSSRSAGPPPGIPVSVALVERRAMPDELTASGTVEPVNTVAIQAQVGGIIQEVGFREGDTVTQGQVLFRIDPRPYESALDQAKAMLARDQAQWDNAEQNARRLEALVAKDYVTTQQYDDARASAGALKGTVEADRAAVETARLNLQYATIRSPIAGRAGGLLVRPGNLVRANSGTPLVVINQLRPIYVRFAVPAAHLPRIRRYQGNKLQVRVRPTTGGTTAAGDSADVRVGTLSFLDNAVDSSTGTILLKATFPNKDAMLWPGEFVTAALQLYVQPDAIVVPAEALVTGQRGAYVFVVSGDNKATTRVVSAGRTVGDLTVVESGLQPGERVVTDGQIRLTEGAVVQIKPAAGSSATGAQ